MDINKEWMEKKKRFIMLWQHLSIDSSHPKIIEDIWNNITSRYSEPSRFYHTREHIIYCLNQLDNAKNQILDKQTVELAIWFHDIVFDTKAEDNEKKSALLFQKLAEVQLPENIIKKVSELIIATMHTDKPADKDQAFLVDIDLSSIAGTWEHFTEDNNKLRKEVSHLSEQEYCQNKISFFNMLLQRERIYFTDYFYETCEFNARQNIEKYIKRSTLNKQRDR